MSFYSTALYYFEHLLVCYMLVCFQFSKPRPNVVKVTSQSALVYYISSSAHGSKHIRLIVFGHNSLFHIRTKFSFFLFIIPLFTVSEHFFKPGKAGFYKLVVKISLSTLSFHFFVRWVPKLSKALCQFLGLDCVQGRYL